MTERSFDIRDAREFVYVERGQADHRFIDSSFFQTKKGVGATTPDAYEISVQEDLRAIYERIEMEHRLPSSDYMPGHEFANLKAQRKLSETTQLQQPNRQAGQTSNIQLQSPKLSRLSEKNSVSASGSQIGIKQPYPSQATPKPSAVKEPNVAFQVEAVEEGDQGAPPIPRGKTSQPSLAENKSQSSGQQKLQQPKIDLSKVSLPLQNDSRLFE